MSKRFQSAHERIAWAEDQFLELKDATSSFFLAQDHRRMSHTDKKTGYTVDKIRFTGSLTKIDRNTFQIIESLRASLDHATTAVVTGAPHKRKTYFPFGDTRRELRDALRTKCKHVPDEIKTVLSALQTYKRGNPPLWALNKICNTCKHRTIVRPGMIVKNVETDIPNHLYVLMFVQPRWDGRKNEIVISKAPGEGTAHHDVEFSVGIKFGKVPVFGGQPVFAGLRYLTSMVKGVVMAIEAEARRIGMK